MLVHEALFREYYERPDVPLPPSVVRHIVASHTDVADVARLATQAGVKTLVLSHFVPTEGANTPTDDQWLAVVRRHFKGEIVLGRDLLEI